MSEEKALAWLYWCPCLATLGLGMLVVSISDSAWAWFALLPSVIVSEVMVRAARVLFKS